MITSEFENLMSTIADGWNEGNPTKSVECFTNDAMYMEPPDKQLVKGKDALYKYFGGDDAKPKVMKLEWHNLFFNEEKQMGSGEYTFEMNNIIHHGVAIVELEQGKIKFWREYDVPGALSYQDFLSEEGKTFAFSAST